MSRIMHGPLLGKWHFGISGCWKVLVDIALSGGAMDFIGLGVFSLR
jgi:hypothetical protein